MGKRGKGKGRSGAARVGLFGHLGAQNLGNDASMQAILQFLSIDHPDAVVDAMCPGPEELKAKYGIDAIHMFWFQKYERGMSGWSATALKTLGKGLDTVRTIAWVRRHDVVIVPGAGVLEASLPLWPWGMPYGMFLLSAAGRIFKTKVAFVCVGAGAINKSATRWLSNAAARLAFYRSYRDAGAWEAMRKRGVDVSRDHVYPDLVFALAHPGDVQSVDKSSPVGVGVMAYYGSNDDRKHAAEIYASYLSSMKQFVHWLLDNGRRVRLLVGDANGSDDSVVEEILADVRASRPDLEQGRLDATAITSYSDLMEAIMPLRSVVAIRYHNLVCATKLSKPTISISYSPKHDTLMENMGLSGFSQPVRTLDVDKLIDQFRELESRAEELRLTMMDRNRAYVELLDSQFAELSAVLFPSGEAAPVPLALPGALVAE